MRLRRLLAILAALALLIPAAPALAHGGHNSPVQTFTQQVGPYPLAVTVEFPPSVPATLYLVVAPQDEIGEATIEVRAVPRGFPLDDAQPATIPTFAGTRLYYSQVPVDRAGDWELDVRVTGARGAGQARIPFTITLAPAGQETVPLAITLGGMFLLMLTSMGLAGFARRSGRQLPAALDRGIGYAIFACVVVAATLVAQQLAAQLQGTAASAATVAVGRPHVNVALRTEPEAPLAGQPFTLTLELTDGSTGLPVDDLVPHHDALMHLVLIDDSGAAFAHVHPAGVAPGRFSLSATLPRPGGYTAYVEVERQDSGTQIIARRFPVAGPAAPLAPDPPGLGAREAGGMRVTVAASSPALRAGRQATLTFSFADADGRPVTDLQPWLGMAGHLIARSEDGQVYGHIHAAGAMVTATSTADVITPPSYGPDVQFVYTFPQAGRYRLWAQFQRDGQIVTVPLLVDVAS